MSAKERELEQAFNSENKKLFDELFLTLFNKSTLAYTSLSFIIGRINHNFPLAHFILTNKKIYVNENFHRKVFEHYLKRTKTMKPTEVFSLAAQVFQFQGKWNHATLTPMIYRAIDLHDLKGLQTLLNVTSLKYFPLALTRAAANGTPEIIKFLVKECKLSVNPPVNAVKTKKARYIPAILCATRKLDNFLTILRLGGDISLTDYGGHNALYYALQAGCLSVVQYLLETKKFRVTLCNVIQSWNHLTGDNYKLLLETWEMTVMQQLEILEAALYSRVNPDTLLSIFHYIAELHRRETPVSSQPGVLYDMVPISQTEESESPTKYTITIQSTKIHTNYPLLNKKQQLILKNILWPERVISLMVEDIRAPEFLVTLHSFGISAKEASNCFIIHKLCQKFDKDRAACCDLLREFVPLNRKDKHGNYEVDYLLNDSKWTVAATYSIKGLDWSLARLKIQQLYKLVYIWQNIYRDSEYCVSLSKEQYQYIWEHSPAGKYKWASVDCGSKGKVEYAFCNMEGLKRRIAADMIANEEWFSLALLEPSDGLYLFFKVEWTVPFKLCSEKLRALCDLKVTFQ